MASRAARLALAPLAGGTVAVRRDAAPAPVTITPAAVRALVDAAVQREVEVVRQDAAGFGFGGRWYNPAMGTGGPADRRADTTFVPGLTIPQAIVDALLRFNGLASQIVRREAYDCTREGFTLGSDATAERLREYACESISGHPDDDVDDALLSLVGRARTYALAYGGAAILPLIEDGRDPSLPVDYGNIRKIQGARVVTRWQISAASYDRRHDSPRVGMPETYNVSVGGVSVGIVHHSRVIVMQGMDLPDHLMRQNSGWGGSLFEAVWTALMNYQVVQDMLPVTVSRMNQGIHTMKGLEAGVAAGYKEQITARFEAQQAAFGLTGDQVLPPGDTYEVVSRQISGIRDVLESLKLDVVANANGQPALMLYQEHMGGLRSGDNPEIKAWNGLCAGRQTSIYTSPARRLLRLVSLATEGPTGGQPVDLRGMKWNPLEQESQSEKDASKLSRAQRRSIDVNSGVVSKVEARTDPDVAELYPGYDPENEPAAPGEDPSDGVAMDDDMLDDEAESVPVVAADASQIPTGEALVPLRRAARELGRTTLSIMRDAESNLFPVWRDRGRWKVAMSLVRASMRPHVFTPAAE